MRNALYAVCAIALAMTAGCAEAEKAGQDGGSNVLGDACTTTNECTEGLTCTDGICTQSCTEDFDCPTGFVCEQQICTENRSNNSTNNSTNNGPGECSPECTDNQECIEGECVDIEPVCDPECGENQECIEGECVDIEPVCDPECGENQECIEGECVDIEPVCDPECGENQECIEGACVDIEPVCDPECETNFECVDGECQHLYPACEAAGDPCDDITDLGDTWGCVVADNTMPESDASCRATCEDTQDCEEGAYCGQAQGSEATVCLPSNCTGLLGDECTAISANCAPVAPNVLACVPAGLGQTGDDCTGQEDCDLGLVCTQDKCATVCDTGAPECEEGLECAALDGYGENAGACVRTGFCFNNGGLCEGASWDDRRLRCVASDPLNPEVMTCLQSCSRNAGCPAEHTCQRFVRGNEFLEVCTPANCSSPLRHEECQAMGENGGSCIPREDGINRCWPAGTNTEGQECASNIECVSGMACNDGLCGRICTRFSGTCAEGEFCKDLPDSPGAGTCTADECEPQCADTETCFRGQCRSNIQCEIEGQPCLEETEGAGNFECLAGANRDDPEEVTCSRLCNPGNGDANCDPGSYCTPYQNIGYCVRSQCNGPFDFLNCEEGQACRLQGNGAAICQPAGEGELGTPCTVNTECGANLLCAYGECQNYCTLRSEVSPCAEDRECLPVFSNDRALGLCGSGCPSFDTIDECAEGFGCFPLDDENGVCVERGDGEIGDACTSSDECPAFSGCYTVTSQDPECRALCDRRQGYGDEYCNDGEICLGAFSIEVNGLCLDGCRPFLSETFNGCEDDGYKACIAIENQQRGLCIESGDGAIGDRCNFIDGSIFGDCVGNAACDPSSNECRRLCRTFSSVNDYDSGCPDDQRCALWGLEYGVCNNNFQPEATEEFAECDPDLGQWCSEDVLCASSGDTGQCLRICRAYEGDSDCPGELTCQLGYFTSDSIGLCMEF